MSETKLSKKCSKCQQHKPVNEFYPRKVSKDGRRGTCIECWLDHYRPGKRVSYAKHKERLNAEKRAKRAMEPSAYRRNDMRYYLRHKERKLAYNRMYYRRHRERLILESLARRKRSRSLDYGWTQALPNDRVQYGLWQSAESARQRQQAAREKLAAVVSHLSHEQRKFLAVFQACEMDIAETARRFNISEGSAGNIMLSIRRVATRAIKQAQP